MSLPEQFWFAGLTPFGTLAWGAIALVYGAYIFGYLIRGSFGFGSNLPAVLLTAWVFGPHHAVLLAAMVAAIMQLHLMPQGVSSANWSRVLPIVATMTLGSAIGVWVLARIDAKWLLVLLGLLVAALVLADVCKLLARLGRRWNMRSPRLAAALGFISSTVGTISGGGALYLLAPFLKLAAQTPLEFRSTNVMIGGLSMMTRILMLSYAGLITMELIVESIALVPVAVGAALGGTRFFKSASPERFFMALQVMLLGAAILLFAKGLIEATG
ncbi:MAG: TSUP family transporter [Chromatiales bacterium]|jgi:uncharacterized protein|nr:TSUP family transporter [Chromatiales bacterium]